MVLTTRPIERLDEDQPNRRPDHADQHALRDKYAPHLGLARAHRHEHGDIARLLHYHHCERNENVERSNEYNQTDGDEGNQPLQPQGAEDSFILLHPVRGHEAAARRALKLARDFYRLVDIIDLELNY